MVLECDHTAMAGPSALMRPVEVAPQRACEPPATDSPWDRPMAELLAADDDDEEDECFDVEEFRLPIALARSRLQGERTYNRLVTPESSKLPLSLVGRRQPASVESPTSKGKSAARVEKHIRARVHLLCHLCHVKLGSDLRCAACGHTRCKDCRRQHSSSFQHPSLRAAQAGPSSRTPRASRASSHANLQPPRQPQQLEEIDEIDFDFVPGESVVEEAFPHSTASGNVTFLGTPRRAARQSRPGTLALGEVEGTPRDVNPALISDDTLPLSPSHLSPPRPSIEDTAMATTMPFLPPFPRQEILDFLADDGLVDDYPVERFLPRRHMSPLKAMSPGCEDVMRGMYAPRTRSPRVASPRKSPSLPADGINASLHSNPSSSRVHPNRTLRRQRTVTPEGDVDESYTGRPQNSKHYRHDSSLQHSSTEHFTEDELYSADDDSAFEEEEIQRVYKRTKQNVRYICERCTTAFHTHQSLCHECGHTRCRSCRRDPPRRPPGPWRDDTTTEMATAAAPAAAPQDAWITVAEATSATLPASPTGL